MNVQSRAGPRASARGGPMSPLMLEAPANRPSAPLLDEAAQRVLAVTRGAWFPSEESLRLRAELQSRLSPLADHAPDDGTAALVLASVLESLVHALPPEIRWLDQHVRMSERLAQAVVRRDAAGMSSALAFLLHGGPPPSHVPLP